MIDNELHQLMKSIPASYGGYEFTLKNCADCGCVLIMTDKNGWISDKISDSDPYYPGRHVNKVSPVHELCSSSGECKRAKNTADALNEFLLRCHKILENHEVNIRRKRKGKYPINFLITRFPGKYSEVPSFSEKYGLKTLSISSCGIAKGFSKFIKIDYLLSKDAEDSINSAIKYLDHYDLIYVTFPDIPQYQIRDPVEKSKYIEKIDMALEKIPDLDDTLVLVSANRLYSIIGSLVNSGEDYSIIASGKNVRKDHLTEFSEKNCYMGPLRIQHDEVLNVILNHMNRALLYGLRPGAYLLDYIPADEDLEHLKYVITSYSIHYTKLYDFLTFQSIDL